MPTGPRERLPGSRTAGHRLRGRSSATTVATAGHRWVCWWVSRWVTGTPDAEDALAAARRARGARRRGRGGPSARAGRRCGSDSGNAPRASTSVGISRADSSGGSSPTSARWAPEVEGRARRAASRAASSNARPTASSDVAVTTPSTCACRTAALTPRGQPQVVGGDDEQAGHADRRPGHRDDVLELAAQPDHLPDHRPDDAERGQRRDAARAREVVDADLHDLEAGPLRADDELGVDERALALERRRRRGPGAGTA